MSVTLSMNIASFMDRNNCTWIGKKTKHREPPPVRLEQYLEGAYGYLAFD
jgi:hypothetical protein